jgi:hypothetical protein
MDQADLLAKVDEVEALLRSGVAGYLDRVERLLLSIARSAPTGEVSNLAMKALSAARAPKYNSQSSNAADALNEALLRLRVAVVEARGPRP